jgi:hypothetical protein
MLSCNKKTVDERTINTFGQSQQYCAGVATPDPDEAPPMAVSNMKSTVNKYTDQHSHEILRKIDSISYHFVQSVPHSTD